MDINRIAKSLDKQQEQVNRILEIEPSDIDERYASWPSYEKQHPIQMLHGQSLHLLPKDEYSSTLYLFRRQHVGLLLALARFNLGASQPDASAAIDVGANIGYVSAALALRSDIERVYAFEPNGQCFEILSLNAERYPKICPKRLALQDSTGTSSAILNVAPNRSAWGMIDLESLSNGFEGEAVPCTTLDSWLDEEQKTSSFAVSLLKIDVEGNEEAVLNGGLRLVAKYNPLIVCELSSDDSIRRGVVAALDRASRECAISGIGKFWLFDESGFVRNTSPEELINSVANDVILSYPQHTVRV